MMRTENNIKSPVQKLIHIGIVSMAMVLTLGVAVGVSGKTTDSSNSHMSFVPQSASSVQAAPMLAAVAPVAEEIKAQPELLQDVASVRAQPAVSHRRIVKMVVTAYCPCSKCCGENAAGITASGKLISHNNGRFVAADSSLKFGTKLLIPGYETSAVEVLDRGGAIKGNRIDVFYPTHQQALEWGRRTVNVTILD
jgi:3D (Asp-Asp-Asp) domain-containing protein